jgi:hypothetical protein
MKPTQNKSILSLLALGLSLEVTHAQSLPNTLGKDYLEQRIIEKLDRVLNPEEYVLDLKVVPSLSGAKNAPAGELLPGLEAIGAIGKKAVPAVSLGGSAELLIIFDKKVSKERTLVARDLALRIIEAEGLKNDIKLSTGQKDINKTIPPPVPKEPERVPSLFDQLVHEKDLVTRALIALWAAIVSLIAIYFVVRRVVLGNPATSHQPLERSQNVAPAHAEMKAPVDDQGLVRPRVNAKTRAELFSKDEHLMSSIKETTEEGKENPKKIARILSRWVSAGDETTREAALFLRNCEIKTMELICNSMHPSELEKMVQVKIDDFEPFGPENLKAVERMRSDLAILASETILKEKPDPLNFMKRLSDLDLCHLLMNEPLETVAMIATQVPAHRMLRYYETLSPSDMKLVMQHFSKISSVSATDLESIVKYFKEKVEVITGNLLSEKDREAAIWQMIHSIPSPKAQLELALKLAQDNAELYTKIRPSLLLATDFNFVQARIKSLITQTIDADTLGIALSELDNDFSELLDGTPIPYQSVFKDMANKAHDATLINRSWKQVSASFSDLTTSGLITKAEINSIIQRAESQKASRERADIEIDAKPGDDVETFRGAS